MFKIHKISHTFFRTVESGREIMVEQIDLVRIRNFAKLLTRSNSVVTGLKTLWVLEQGGTWNINRHFILSRIAPRDA